MAKLTKTLTARQQEVFDFVKQHLEQTGMPPTRAEIAKELGFRSANAAEEHLKALAKKGVIEIVSGTSRGIRLIGENMEVANDDEIGLPLIGKVAAGEPILAAAHIEATYQVDVNMFKPKADFLLKVQGMSMKDIGILDGDLLAVHSTKDVRNGQVVVARINDNVTVKRFERKGDILYLHPENSELSPIIVDLSQENVEIEGIAVGIIRNNAWM
ncbi:LexA family transcriptional regulator [Gallibacterium salpingitidis]|uniref:LexA repressor n=1 Tax=Gallibacterium salpingitidis TaxID=505341 RepID=A0AB36E3H7_9PAST|nr:transcriptional repressor LexA [Gallibacterium salpingitidis]OBX08191.1 LexA family transcriptional regulator [Gallibacterium salpingitidis]OBX11129.1 LexA family transcriptional regulator [Gallibacterium salpingitidis]WKT00103.1 transcriptional repressor LexA [Gallibacterium salpingitidis]